MPELHERMAIIEADARHTREELTKMSSKVDEMYHIITAFKGVKWALIAVAGVMGFIAGKFGNLLALLSGK
jgi:hypothetical protein